MTSGGAARVILGVVVVTAATCAMLEGLVRLASIGPPATQMRGYVADPHIPFKFRPNSTALDESPAEGFRFAIRHNSLGFRDSEHDTPKPPGTVRLVGVGDSFTYGSGAAIEDTYLAQLERRLNAHLQGTIPAEVIKLGLPRYFPAAERAVVEYYGLRFAPDIVLAGVTPNDVVDTYLGLDAVTVSESGYLVPRAAQDLGLLATALFMHSQVARIVFARTLAPLGSRRQPPRADDVYVPGGFHEPDWQAMEADLTAMARLARAGGASLVVVGIPQSGIGDPHADYFDQRLAEWSRREGVVYVAVLPAMRQANGGEPLYWTVDGHCRAAGYRVVADAIAEALIGRGLVP